MSKEAGVPEVVLTTKEAIDDFIRNSKLKELLGWARKNSMWFLTQPMGCCGIEMIAFGCPHYDCDRFGIIPRATPRQADVMIVSGYVSKKYYMAIRKLWEQMPEPKWAIAMGECAISGGPWWESYNMIAPTERLIPIDVYIPGCPPRPESLIQGFLELQRKIKAQQDRVSKEHIH
ncbi:MAG: NADH-quinone oxidoreductase subunit B [Methermicoccaceae archaeon]